MLSWLIRKCGGMWLVMWGVLYLLLLISTPFVRSRWDVFELIFELPAIVHVYAFPIVALVVVVAAAIRVVSMPPLAQSSRLGEVIATWAAGSLMLGALLCVLAAIADTPPGWWPYRLPIWLLPNTPLWCPLVFLLAGAGSAWGLRVASDLDVGHHRRGARLLFMLCGWLLVIGLFAIFSIICAIVPHPAELVGSRCGGSWRIIESAMMNAFLISTLSVPGLLMEVRVRWVQLE